jgi:hypothetical protein
MSDFTADVISAFWFMARVYAICIVGLVIAWTLMPKGHI